MQFRFTSSVHDLTYRPRGSRPTKPCGSSRPSLGEGHFRHPRQSDQVDANEEPLIECTRGGIAMGLGARPTGATG